MLLIEELHADSSLAFKAIFELYYHPLCACAYRYVQEAFLNFWELRKKFRALAVVRSFLLY